MLVSHTECRTHKILSVTTSSLVLSNANTLWGQWWREHITMVARRVRLWHHRALPSSTPSLTDRRHWPQQRWRLVLAPRAFERREIRERCCQYCRSSPSADVRRQRPSTPTRDHATESLQRRRRLMRRRSASSRRPTRRCRPSCSGRRCSPAELAWTTSTRRSISPPTARRRPHGPETADQRTADRSSSAPSRRNPETRRTCTVPRPHSAIADEHPVKAWRRRQPSTLNNRKWNRLDRSSTKSVAAGRRRCPDWVQVRWTWQVDGCASCEPAAAAAWCRWLDGSLAGIECRDQGRWPMPENDPPPARIRWIRLGIVLPLRTRRPTELSNQQKHRISHHVPYRSAMYVGNRTRAKYRSPVQALRELIIMIIIIIIIIITSVQSTCNLAKSRIADLSPLTGANRFTQSWPPPNKLFLWPTRVSLQNGISIGSVILQQSWPTDIHIHTDHDTPFIATCRILWCTECMRCGQIIIILIIRNRLQWFMTKCWGEIVQNRKM